MDEDKIVELMKEIEDIKKNIDEQTDHFAVEIKCVKNDNQDFKNKLAGEFSALREYTQMFSQGLIAEMKTVRESTLNHVAILSRIEENTKNNKESIDNIKNTIAESNKNSSVKLWNIIVIFITSLLSILTTFFITVALK